MKTISHICKSFLNRVHLHWIAHYNNVIGRPPQSGFSHTIYDSIYNVPQKEWDNANVSKDIFLNSFYLKALENAPPENMYFKYAVVKKEDTVIGIVYFQILELDYRLHSSPLRLLTEVRKKTIKQTIHDSILKTARTRLLVCGNALISGEHGFSFSIPQDQALQAVAEVTYEIRMLSDAPVTATLIKDFYKSKKMQPRILAECGFHAFDVGPNMIVPIRKSWDSFGSYLKEMKSKYRKRITTASKKGESIIRKPLSVEEMIQYRKELYLLYFQVAGKARFKLFYLSPDYFVELKRQLGDHFSCDGYFYGQEIVGFTTRIYYNDILEGYTHGLDYIRNKEFELYQNFLIDDVKEAIARRCSLMNTGRTSVAMKSSIGAIPKEMSCSMRFSGSHSNHFVKPLFSFIKPADEYCRNPFER